MTAIRVVLVDDHALMRQGISTILSAQPDIDVVGEASSGEEALDVVARTRPDVVCMDVEMRGIGGIEATRRLTSDPAITAQVVMLTTFEREDYLLAALDAGASGFLLKNTRAEHLVDGIRSIAAGEALLAPELTRAVIERAIARERTASASSASGSTASASTSTTPALTIPALTAPTVTATGSIATASTTPASTTPAGVASESLTDREAEVLRLIARGLSNDEIAELLVIGRATVKTHVSNVLMKLSLRDRVQAVAFAYRNGLVE
jgi:DNA-binding NarL/FixJ family response regulator